MADALPSFSFDVVSCVVAYVAYNAPTADSKPVLLYRSTPLAAAGVVSYTLLLAAGLDTVYAAVEGAVLALSEEGVLKRIIELDSPVRAIATSTASDANAFYVAHSTHVAVIDAQNKQTFLCSADAPKGIAVHNGRLFAAEAERIRVFDISGQGAGQGQSFTFGEDMGMRPSAIAVSASERVFVCCGQRARIFV